MMCDKEFFLKNAISFFFSNQIQNGFHRSEGLIFLDLMHLKKIKFKIDGTFRKNCPSHQIVGNFSKFSKWKIKTLVLKSR